MAPEKDRLTLRESYRHGDVRNEAIACARAMIAEAGEQSLSVRAVAQAISVAHRTLHHHFTDREGLLREVAASGFALLAEILADADEPRAFARRYLEFGLTHPQLYALMMRQRADAGLACEPLRAARDAVIARALAVLSCGESDPDASRRRVMRVWMLLHGGLSLNATATLMTRDPEQFVQEMLRILFADGP